MNAQSTGASLRPVARRGALVPLLIFAVLYLSLLATAAHPLWAVGCAAVAALVAAISRRLGAQPRRRPTEAQLRGVRITSALEGIALVVAVIAGAVTGSWWLALPILLTAVAAHICALDITFRRTVDHWSVACIVAAATASWIFSEAALAWVWPLTAGVAAGLCLGYALALTALRGRGTGTADSEVPPVQEDTIAAHPRANNAKEQS